MSGSGPRFSEQEARELWRRAAELHAAAEQARPSRELVPGEAHGLSFEDVAAAAEGAGIDPDYVRLTVAERGLPDAEEIRRDSWAVRWSRRAVAGSDAIEASRRIPASPARVLEALHAVSGKAPFSLQPESRLGTDPLRDGVFVYRLTDRSSSFGGPMELADARVLLATVRPAGDGAQVRVRVPLFRRGLNLVLSGTATGLLGAGGWWTGVSAGSGLAALLGGATAGLLIVPAGIGAVAGGALGLTAYRKLYQSLVDRASVALNSLLAAVALEAEPPPTTGELPAPDTG